LTNEYEFKINTTIYSVQISHQYLVNQLAMFDHLNSTIC